MKNLLFFEFEDEVEAYLSQECVNPEDTVCIVFTQKAGRKVRQHGYDTEDTVSFFDTSAHERITLQIEEIVQSVMPYLTMKDGRGLQDTYRQSAIQYLRFVCAHLLWVNTIIESACRRYQPAYIGACVCPRTQTTSPLITFDERYVGVLAERYAAKHHLVFKHVPHAVQKERKWSFVPNVARRVSEKVSSYLFSYAFRKTFCDGRPVAAAFFGYNIEHVIRGLQKDMPNVRWVMLLETRNFHVWYVLLAFICLALTILDKQSTLMRLRVPIHTVLPLCVLAQLSASNDNLFEQSLREAKERVCDQLASLDQNTTVPFLDIVLYKWKTSIADELCRMHRVARGLDLLITHAAPDFILSPFSMDDAYTVGELARAHGIPALLIPHGTFRVPNNRYEEIEFDHLSRGVINTAYPYVAAQSPWEVGFAKYYHIKSQVLTTGPLIWSVATTCGDQNTRERILGDWANVSHVVVHAATQKYRSNFRFYINETPDEYVEEIRDIALALSSRSDTVLLVKLRPKMDLSVEDLRLALVQFPRVVISTDSSLADVLSIADLVVSFQSTVIQEAILSHLPVLQYGGNGRFEHFPGIRLSRGAEPQTGAVYTVFEREELAHGLTWLLDNHSGRCLNIGDLRAHSFPDQDQIRVSEFLRECMHERVKYQSPFLKKYL